MAKELAMVERNDKGRQARQYFIECEKRLRRNTGQTSAPENELLDIRQSIKRLEAALEQFQTKDSITLTIEQSNVAKVDRVLKALKRKSDFTTHRELTRSLQSSMKAKELNLLINKLIIDGIIEVHFIKNRRGLATKLYKLIK